MKVHVTRAAAAVLLACVVAASAKLAPGLDPTPAGVGTSSPCAPPSAAWALAWTLLGAVGALVLERVACAAPTTTSKPQGTSTRSSGTVRGREVVTTPRGVDEAGLAFLERAAASLTAYARSLGDASKPLVDFAGPREIEARFAAAGVPMDLAAGCRPLLSTAAATSAGAMDAATALTLQLSVRAGHPLFCNQLCGPVDMAGVVGDWLVAVACMPVHTFEVAPVFTCMERSVLARLRSLVGGDFASGGDGIMLPGGSTCNTYSVHLARFTATLGASKAAGIQAVHGG